MNETKAKKLIKKLIENPKNISFEELDKVLKHFGYERRQPRRGSSHYTYRKIGSNSITIPKHKPIKKTYIKLVISELNLEV